LSELNGHDYLERRMFNNREKIQIYIIINNVMIINKCDVTLTRSYYKKNFEKFFKLYVNQ